MKNIGKYTSIILIIISVFIGFAKTFTASNIQAFYFFLVSVALIMIFSFFVYSGKVKKNLSVITDISKAIADIRQQAQPLTQTQTQINTVQIPQHARGL